MPELPEVETIVRGLSARLPGVRIAALELLRPDFFRGDPEALVGLAGGRVERIRRAGKYIVFDIEAGGRGWQLMVHLGMTGSLRLWPAGEPLQNHTHAVLGLEDGSELRLRDPRRFGQLALAPATGTNGFAPALGLPRGAEPLEVDEAEFVARFHGRQAPIKNLLLNQGLLRGVGNIYADESLHRAGIDPRARAVSAPRLRKLRLALQRVLEEAIAAGGSSISDYVASDGTEGWFQVRHRVYGRTGQRCRRCGGSIRQIVLGGRSAHFCGGCQRR